MLVSIPNYSISVSAMRDYRNGARQDVNLDIEVLKTKINCLIYASDHVSFVLCGQKYTFGKCNFEVSHDGRIRKIYWSEEDNKPTYKELKKLSYAYKMSGLNRNGNKFIEKVS